MSGQLLDGEVIYVVEVFYKFNMLFQSFSFGSFTTPVHGPGLLLDDGILTMTQTTRRHHRDGGVTLTTLLAVVGLAFSAGLATWSSPSSTRPPTRPAWPPRAHQQRRQPDRADANAKAAGQRFFYANFPANYLMSTATLNDINVTFSTSEVTITVSASATMPTALFGGFTSGPMSPGVLTETKRKDLDMVVVLDTSGSLSGSAANVRSSAQTFLNQFNVDRDRVGLLHFSYGAVVDPIRQTARGFDRTSMNNHIKNYSFTGSTASPEGMYAARKQLNSMPTANNNWSNLRVIVFFSDGAPNSFGTSVKWNSGSDCRDASNYLTGTITTDDDGKGTPGGCTSSTSNRTTSAAAHAVRHHHQGQRIAGLVQRPRHQQHRIPGGDQLTARGDQRHHLQKRQPCRAQPGGSDGGQVARRGHLCVHIGIGRQPEDRHRLRRREGRGHAEMHGQRHRCAARCFNAAKPVGVYCFAATQADLTPCFSKLASAICGFRNELVLAHVAGQFPAVAAVEPALCQSVSWYSSLTKLFSIGTNHTVSLRRPLPFLVKLSSALYCASTTFSASNSPAGTRTFSQSSTLPLIW
jgi:hypothetical protein